MTPPFPRFRRAHVLRRAQVLCVLLWLIGPTALAAQARAPDAQARSEDGLSLDEIVSRHIEARGGYERIKSIQTLVFSEGQYREPGFEGSGSARMAFRRPYFRVVGTPGAAAYLEGYDGGSWEWYADPGVVVRTVGAASGATRRGADFEGRLVDWEAKGNQVELGDPTVIEGRETYRITLTTRDGFRRDYFLDAASFLIIAERYVAPVHAFGEPVSSEVRLSDYRPVSGVQFAHRFRETEIATGEVLNEMQWGRIEANVDLPLSHFFPPDFERSPQQRMLEALFAARADSAAVMWSYEEFRRGYPDLNVASGVAFMGYQIQKMGDVAAAVGLLEANLRDFPDSAPAAFALGRGLEGLGRTSDAAAAYLNALAADPGHTRARAALERLR